MKVQQFTRFVYFTDKKGNRRPFNPAAIGTVRPADYPDHGASYIGSDLGSVILMSCGEAVLVTESLAEVTRKLEEATAVTIIAEDGDSYQSTMRVAERFRSFAPFGTAIEDSKPVPGTDHHEVKVAIGNAPASR